MNGNLGAPKRGEIWYQLAEVLTLNWQNLGKEDQLEVAISDCHGAFSRQTKIRKQLFLDTFFPWEDGFFIKMIFLRSFSKEDNAYEVSCLDAQKKSLVKKPNSAPASLRKISSICWNDQVVNKRTWSFLFKKSFNFSD